MDALCDCIPVIIALCCSLSCICDPNACNSCCKAKPPSEDVEPEFPESEVVQEPPGKANAMVLQSH